MKKIVFIIGSMIVGGIIFVVGFNWFVKVELFVEKMLIVECKVLFWYDLMYFNMWFDKSGKLLFMDMDLVLKYVDEESFVFGVCIDLIQMQNLGVKMVIVMCGLLIFVQSFLVNVSYNEYQYVIVQVCVVGFIDKVYLFIVGDKV